jgi:hypothetical protein
MSDRAKELAREISDLISEFEECSPDLSGSLELVDHSGDVVPVDWNLHIDGEDIKIVIETGANAVYIDNDALAHMVSASNFFLTLGVQQRKLLMSILERDDED